MRTKTVLPLFFYFISISCLSGFSGTAQAQNPALTVAHQLSHTVNADPSLSPDGKRMVFISVVAGKEQLLTMGIDESDPRQLTHDDADHEDPAWSPDGRRIAFVLKKGDLEEIYLMNADGSDVEALSPKGVRLIHPNWAPDSQSVA